MLKNVFLYLCISSTYFCNFCYFVYTHNYLKVAKICKGKELPQNINILSFNVEGLKPKLEDPNFLEFIKDYDISIFSETWKADTSKLNIEGFWDYSQVRSKHKNAIRHSEPITILVKHNVRSRLKIVEYLEGFLWTRLEKSFFNPENDTFFCGAKFHQKLQAKMYYLKQTILALLKT